MENKSEFLRAERLGDYWENYARSLESPFSVNSFLTEFLVRIFQNVALALERLNGQNIYVKKSDSNFDLIPSRFHKLIWQLKDDGILEKILFPEPIPDWPRVPAIRLQFGPNKTFSSGYALDYDTASTKALAELLEWQAFTEPDTKNFILGTWNELRTKRAVDPKCFASFSEKQLAASEYAPHWITNDTKLSWIKCLSILDGKEYLLPAQLAYYGYKFLPQEPLIRQSTSNGGAAGNSTVMALVHGLLEAIERDALMIHWLNKITPPRINIDSLEILGNETIFRIIGEYRKYKIDFALLDITTDLEVPVILTVIRDNAPGRTALFLGAGADLDVESAIIHSLLEGLRAGYWTTVSEKQIATVNKKAPLIENIEERRAYWCDKSRIREADFFFGGLVKQVKRNEFYGADDNKKMKRLKDILKTNGIKSYYVDCTSKIADKFGLKIIMTLVPELCSLYLNERFKYLGVKRLYEAPVRMGAFKKPKKEEEMNALPHPFL